MFLKVRDVGSLITNLVGWSGCTSFTLPPQLPPRPLLAPPLPHSLHCRKVVDDKWHDVQWKSIEFSWRWWIGCYFPNFLWPFEVVAIDHHLVLYSFLSNFWLLRGITIRHDSACSHSLVHYSILNFIRAIYFSNQVHSVPGAHSIQIMLRNRSIGVETNFWIVSEHWLVVSIVQSGLVIDQTISPLKIVWMNYSNPAYNIKRALDLAEWNSMHFKFK